MEYDKTQYGKILISIFIIIILLLIYIYQLGHNSSTSFIILFIMFFVFPLFYKLRVRVESSIIHIVFGIGLIHIRIRPEKIINVIVVKNPWYYGLGIRVTPRGLLYCISGLDAIELEYEQKGSKKRVRIGSADPDILKRAIEVNFKFTSVSNKS